MVNLVLVVWVQGAGWKGLDGAKCLVRLVIWVA